jgi:hypothetical protein
MSFAIEYAEVGIGDCLIFTRRNGQDERTGVVIRKSSKVTELHIKVGAPVARLRQEDWEAHNVRRDYAPNETQRLFQELVWAKGEMAKAEREMQAASGRAAEASASWAMAELLSAHGVELIRLTGMASGKVLLQAREAERVMCMFEPGDGEAWALSEVVDYFAEFGIEAELWTDKQAPTGIVIPVSQVQVLLNEISDSENGNV